LPEELPSGSKPQLPPVIPPYTEARRRKLSEEQQLALTFGEEEVADAIIRDEVVED
jgi:hypothetical protein